MIYTKAFWFLFFAAGGLFAVGWSMATDGYGYAGYGAEKQAASSPNASGRYYGNSGPSFFYMGGANHYPNASLRKGSVGGSRSFGGGPGSGK